MPRRGLHGQQNGRGWRRDVLHALPAARTTPAATVAAAAIAAIAAAAAAIAAVATVATACSVLRLHVHSDDQDVGERDQLVC